MLRAGGDTAAQPRDESNRLIVRRLRIGLAVILAGILISLVSDHALLDRPVWKDLLDMVATALVALAFWLSGRRVVRAHPVPFALCVVALTCGIRAVSGIWSGDLTQTAILCIAVALTAGAALPWGVRPQLATIALAGAAIAANVFLATGRVTDPHPLPHFAVAVVIALAVSVVLAYELQRHRLELLAENLQRQR